ncbi:hypothetical protein DID88_009361 [Monilinia fructigena]|uniref:Ubiquitin 3 binding protein But2 C-terminal domain-containing protein n=1 Tax=Monilinia fructigena TaxID=38457 RepID=A0A395IMR1_9HELO|nr:hypothetical protein DID88_009361 [Monilinia fructigena]
MKFSFGGLVWGVVSYAAVARAACSSDLLIDNYATYASNTNSLGQWTSDDGTTTNIKTDAANKKIAFTSKANSYFYTTFNCEKATTDQYNAITFPVKGPAGASFTLELQTMSSCTATSFKSYYTTINGITGSTQVITVPLSAFSGANLNAISGLLWESFSLNGAWEIGQTNLVCANGAGAPSTTSNKGAIVTSSSATNLRTATPSITSKVLTSSVSASAPAGACTNLLVDDFASQSRLTFLFYNAMLQPSSDDGTMSPVAGRVDTATSVIVANNHVTLTSRADGSSYWFTMLGCLKATSVYGGIGMTIKAAKGTKLGIELQTSRTCDSNNPTLIDVSSADLEWTFDGTEKFYTIPFSKIPRS